MKKMITILSLVLVSCTAFGTEIANDAERAFLCTAVNKMLEENSVEAALDMEKCLKTSKLSSRLVSEGIRNIEGELTFNSPDRLNYKLNCSAAYYEKAKLENIVGGIEFVSCE